MSATQSVLTAVLNEDK